MEVVVAPSETVVVEVVELSTTGVVVVASVVVMVVGAARSRTIGALEMTGSASTASWA